MCFGDCAVARAAGMKRLKEMMLSGRWPDFLPPQITLPKGVVVPRPEGPALQQFEAQHPDRVGSLMAMYVEIAAEQAVMECLAKRHRERGSSGDQRTDGSGDGGGGAAAGWGRG